MNVVTFTKLNGVIPCKTLNHISSPTLEFLISVSLLNL